MSDQSIPESITVKEAHMSSKVQVPGQDPLEREGTRQPETTVTPVTPEVKPTTVEHVATRVGMRIHVPVDLAKLLNAPISDRARYGNMTIEVSTELAGPKKEVTKWMLDLVRHDLMRAKDAALADIRQLAIEAGLK